MVTKEQILDIALLAKLNVSDEEADSLTEEMQNIIAFADTINAAADEGGDFDNINNLENRFHEDIVKQSFPQSEILKNAENEDGSFHVSKKQV